MRSSVAAGVKDAGRRLLWPRDLAARRPPRCPSGSKTGPPDYVGVGVQKAGTSWWHSLITAHPESYSASSTKELHYFDNSWSHVEANMSRGYHQFFPRPEGTIAGEWTPRYLSDFWVPPLLAHAAPRARILVMLRDPVDRFESGVTHELAYGGRVRPIVAADAAARGHYHRHLTALLRHYPREQVLVLQYERCRDDPEPQLRLTYEFLGIDPTFVPRTLGARVNETRTARFRPPDTMRAELVALYRTDVERLVVDFPEIDVSLWTHFRELVRS